MSKNLMLIAVILLLGFGTARASNVGVDLNVQIGNPPPPPPPRVIVTQPGPYEDVYVYDDDIDFIYPSQLGFYIGVGVPYDLFFINNFYFSYRNGYWYRGHSHRGPWVVVEHRHLPPGLRKHRMERIHYYRDREYRVYKRDRDHYRGRYGRLERGEWKEHRRGDRDYREERYSRDDRRYDKERRKDERRYEKEQRKDEQRMEKQERRQDRDERRGGQGNERGGGHGRD